MVQNSQRPAAKMQQPSGPDMDRVSWDDLRLFVVAARQESFRKAATVLKTSSSTLVRRIERLEEQLGVRLFDRLPEGISLTGEGQRALHAAQEMERASQSLRGHLDQDLTTRGVVRAAITEGLGTYWVLPFLGDFCRANPFTVVDVRATMDYTDVLRMKADLAVQLTRPTAPDLICVKLGRIHSYPFASRQYLRVYGTPKTKADLLEHKFVDQVSPMLDEGIVPMLLGVKSVEGIVSFRTNSSTAHYGAVAMGLGIGALPTYALALNADVVPLDLNMKYQLDIWLTYNADVKELPRVMHFVEWLRSIFDCKRYPWFSDEFIHPEEFRGWQGLPQHPF